MLKARTGVPELRCPALVCLSAIEQNTAYYFVLYITVLVYLMDQNPKCPGYN